MEPQRARTRSGLAYSAATPSGLRGRPEVGTDVSPGVEMVEVGVGMEMQPTSPNPSPPTSTPERLPLDYQLDTNSPNLPTPNQNPQNLTPQNLTHVFLFFLTHTNPICSAK